jgi:hypothetical protein
MRKPLAASEFPLRTVNAVARSPLPSPPVIDGYACVTILAKVANRTASAVVRTPSRSSMRAR